MTTELENRIPVPPALMDEIEALLDDPARLARLDGVHRKTIERMRREGLPKQLRLFVQDAGIARALVQSVEQAA